MSKDSFRKLGKNTAELMAVSKKVTLKGRSDGWMGKSTCSKSFYDSFNV